MKSFKNLHTADWHLIEPNIEQTKPAIEFLTQEVHTKRPDSVTIAGDLGVKRGMISATESKIIRTNIYSMAEICKVFIIPGNHDLTNRYDRVDTVQGILSWDKDGRATNHPNIFIGSAYSHIDTEINGVQVRVYFLPHPSKYIYLTKKRDIAPTKINSEMSKAMESLLLGIEQDRISWGGQSMLIGHGTIKGGIADSEVVMTAEHDLALDKNWLPNCGAIQYGHLHRPQTVGRAVYSGAIAPLQYNKNVLEPSYCMWEIPESGEGTFERVPIPVANQLITVEVTSDIFTDDVAPTAAIKKMLSENTIQDAHVRCRVTIDENLRSLVDQGELRRYMDSLGAKSHKLIIESEGTIKVRLDGGKADMNTKDLLEAWNGLDPDRKDYKKELLDLHSIIVNKLPKAAMDSLHGIDYEILSIEVKNYKPLIDMKIIFDELGSIIVITGENHIGKSQIAEVERFVFWKILRRGTLLSDVVRIGTTDASATIMFKARGEIYNITRLISLNKNMTANGVLNFTQKMSNGTWEPVNEGSAGETQTAINNIVGTYNMYRTTRFGSQSDIDLLCRMLPSEMKDALQEAMNYEIFEAYQTICEELLDELEKKFTSSFDKINELKQNLTGEESQIELKKSIEEEIKTFTDGIKLVENNIKTISDEISKYENDLKKSKELKIETDKLNNSKSVYNSNITSETEALNNKQAAETAIKRLKEKRDELEKVTKEKNELIQLTGDIDKQENKINSEINIIQGYINNDKKEIENINIVITGAKNKWQQKLDELKRDIERYNEAGSLVKDVPCADMDINSTCKLLANARSSNEMAEKTQLEFAEHEKADKYDSDYDKDLINAESGLTKDKLEKDGYDEQLEHLKNERIKLLDGKTPVRDLEIKIQSLNNDLFNLTSENWDDKLQKANLAEGNIKTYKSEIEKIETQLDEISNELSDMPLNLEKIDTQKTELDSFNLRLKNDFDTKEGKVKTLGTVERRLEEFDEKKVQLKELEKINETGVRQIKVQKMYRQAMSRDGIPYLLLEKALPQFEKYTNEFLCADEGFANSLRVQVKATKDTQSGKSKDEVVISFIDDRGTHPLGEASGFQKVAIGYALRASMAKLQTEATGAIIHHCIFDEGWGAFDQPNQLLGKRIIQKLGEEFEKFFYITHVPALQEVADSQIKVFAVNGGADIEVC